MDFFFETKGRSIVISFKKKKKKQLYITHRIEHHHTQTTHMHNTHTHNKNYKILYHHDLGEEPKKPPQPALLSSTLCHG
jgi:hypothetical protein